MRKFTLLFSGLLLVASSVATAQSAPKYERQIAKTATAYHKDQVFKPANAIEPKTPIRLAPEGKSMKAKSAKVNEEWNIITEAPEGNTVMYRKESYGYFPYIFWLMEYDEDNNAAEIVFTDNNEVYFKNIFSHGTFDTYVKGTLADGIITVDMGQCVYFSEEYGYGYALAILDVDAEGNGAIDNSKKSVTFTVAADGSITMDENTILALAYTDDGTWASFADFAQSYTVFTDTPVSKPESVATEEWAMTTTDGGGHIVNVGIDGNDIYIGNLTEMMPDAWIKGTIDGDKVTVNDTQYMGIYSDMFQYLMNAKISVNFLGKTDYTLTGAPMEFKYDAAAKTLSTDAKNAAIVNASLKKIYYLDLINGPEMYFFDGFKPAVPADPTNLYTEGFNPSQNIGAFQFTLPIVDTEGKLMDKDSYYYNIFVDNYLFTLYPDEYTSIIYDGYEELTDIPYSYSDYWDIEAEGIEHSLYFYFEGFETLGVQTVYTVDGVTNKSALVNFNIETGETTKTDAAGIDAVTAPKEIKAVTYYDLTGRKLAKPVESGVTIKRTEYTDGTVRSVKCLSK